MSNYQINDDLDYELSKEVLRLTEESNGTLTINQALEIIVRQYKESHGLENKFNNSVHLENYIFKVGDKFKHENGVVGTIVGIDNDLINLSQHSAEYGYYPNITVTANVLTDLLSRKQLIRIKEGENIGTIKQ